VSALSRSPSISRIEYGGGSGKPIHCRLAAAASSCAFFASTISWRARASPSTEKMNWPSAWRSMPS
jgi:hypothetical protein